MTALVFTCLLGIATPVAPQGTLPPPPVVQQGQAGSQGQQTPSQQAQQGQRGQGQTPQGRGGRGAPTPAPPTSEAPSAKPVTPAHYDSASLANIRIEVSLSDSAQTDGPSKRTVTMMVVDNNNGQMRSQVIPGNNVLNVDAMPHVRPDGRIYLSLTLFYVPEPASTTSGQTRTPATLNEALSVIVPDGKPMLISQSADPRGDRKVTVEVTATVVK